MEAIKRFIRLSSAKYTELIGAQKIDEGAFYFLEDTAELFKGTVQLTDAVITIDSIDTIPAADKVRKGRLYVDQNGGVAAMVNDQWVKFVDPSARAINYVEDASVQPANAKQGVFYFDGANLGIVNGASYVNFAKLEASVVTMVPDATAQPANLVAGHFYLDLNGNLGVGMQQNESVDSLVYNVLISPSTNYITASEVDTKVKTAVDDVNAKNIASDKAIKDAVDATIAALTERVTAVEGNFDGTKAKEAAVADVAKELETLPVATIATKEEVKTAVDGLKADVDATMLTKVDVVVGKQLSTEDFTTEEKEKLAGLENYTLPAASEEVAGGVKVGEGLYVTEDGKLNVTATDLSALATKEELTTATEGVTKASEVEETYAKKTDIPDITPLATKEEVTAAVDGVAKTADVDAKLADYAKTADVEEKLAAKADVTAIPDITPLATKEEVTAATTGLVKAEELETKLADYAKTSAIPDITPLATKEELTQAVDGVAKTADVDAKLADYAKTTDIANTYATKDAIEAVAGLDADTVKNLKDLAADTSGLGDVADKLQNVYNKTEVDEKLATKADATAIPDITPLATKEEVKAAVDGVAKTTEVEAKLADYAKKTEVPSIEGLATKEEVTTATTGLVKVEELDTKLADYAKTSAIPDVSELATKEEVKAAVDGVAKTTEVEAKLADYAKKTDIPEAQDLSNYVTKDQLPVVPDTSTLATKEEVTEATAHLVNEVALDQKLEGYLKKTDSMSIEGLAKEADVDEKLATKADVSAIPDITPLATKEEVKAAVEGVAKTTEVEETYAKKTDIPDITPLATKEDLTKAVDGVAKTTEVEAKLADYAKKTEVPDITPLATKEEVTTATTGLVKAEELETKLADYVKTSAIPDVSGFAKASEVADTYATKEAVAAVAGLDADTVKNLKDLAEDLKDGELEAVANKLQDIYNKKEVDDKLATKADITAIPDITPLATKDEVKAISDGISAKNSELDAKLADYAKKTDVTAAVNNVIGEKNLVSHTELDDNYLTKYDVENKLAGYVSEDNLGTAVDLKLADYLKTDDANAIFATKSEIPDTSTLVNEVNLGVKLEDYVKKTDLDTSKIVTTDSLPTAIGDEFANMGLDMASLAQTIKELQAQVALAPKVGPTESRPSENLQAGMMYYDTTLNDMLVYNGTEWEQLKGTEITMA